MFSGGPPYHLMWSSIYNREKPVISKPADWLRIARLFKGYWHEQLKLLSCIFCSSIAGLMPALLTKWIIDRAIPDHNFHQLILFVLAMILSAVVAALLGVYQGYLNSLIGEGIIRDIRADLVTHLHKMPLSFFEATKTGEIMNRVANDIESVDTVLTMTLVTVITNIFVIATSFVAIFLLDWRLALISLLVIPLMILPMWPVGSRIYDVRKASREKRDEIESITQETLSVSGITLRSSWRHCVHT